MILEQLIKELRNCKGAVFVDVINHNDSYWIKAVKEDIIFNMTASFKEGEETGFTFDRRNGVNYFSKDYAI